MSHPSTAGREALNMPPPGLRAPIDNIIHNTRLGDQEKQGLPRQVAPANPQRFFREWANECRDLKIQCLTKDIYQRTIRAELVK